MWRCRCTRRRRAWTSTAAAAPWAWRCPPTARSACARRQGAAWSWRRASLWRAAWRATRWRASRACGEPRWAARRKPWRATPGARPAWRSSCGSRSQRATPRLRAGRWWWRRARGARRSGCRAGWTASPRSLRRPRRRKRTPPKGASPPPNIHTPCFLLPAGCEELRRPQRASPQLLTWSRRHIITTYLKGLFTTQLCNAPLEGEMRHAVASPFEEGSSCPWSIGVKGGT
mmetsp:Transcript_13710/g.34579  ORF Transcript_13710/g.34579 Transcript_13710/m.34579 type:complete len:230 (+) Transcript_13710:168-857(+)